MDTDHPKRKRARTQINMRTTVKDRALLEQLTKKLGKKLTETIKIAVQEKAEREGILSE